VNQQALYLLERALGSERPSFGDSLQRFFREAGQPDPELTNDLENLRSREGGRSVDL